MTKVITTITADGLDFFDICSFKTRNYTGIYSHNHNTFILIEDLSIEFRPCILQVCNNLKTLDQVVWNECGEHIEEVFESNTYEFILKTEE